MWQKIKRASRASQESGRMARTKTNAQVVQMKSNGAVNKMNKEAALDSCSRNEDWQHLHESTNKMRNVTK